MRILIITDAFPPQSVIAAQRPYSWAKYWSKAGHTVHVLTTYKACATTNSYKDLSYRVFDIDYMKYYPYIGRYILPVESIASFEQGTAAKRQQKKSLIRQLLARFFSNTGAIAVDCRMPNLYQLWPKYGIKKILEEGERYDVAVATFAPFATFKIGYELKKRGVVRRLVLDYRDLWVENPYRGIFGFRSIEKLIERKWVRKADVITTVSSPLAELLSLKFKRQVEVILNGFDLDDLKAAEKLDLFKKEETNIMYAGSFYGNYRDPEPIIQALSELNDAGVDISNIHLYFASGNGWERIETLTNKYKLKNNISNLGQIPRNNVLYLEQQADILLFLSHNGKGGEGFLGGKLSELLFSGTYVWVIGGYGQPAEIFKQYECGTFLGNDTNRIKAALQELINGIKPEVGKKASEAVIFTREYQANKMLTLLE